VGVGWAKQEFEALGAPFDRRGELASEYLEAIKLCWANDIASYEGQFISFNNVQTGPRPSRATGLPVWVGGSSTAALKRAVRYGDAWHPYRFSMDWLKEKALPKLKEIAGIEEKPVPSLCPRLRLRLTESPLPERRRPVGHGSINQIGADIEALASLGAEYILLDTYNGRPEQTLQPEKDWEMLRILADNVLDLKNQTLRNVR
jgi:hypothetical protein